MREKSRYLFPRFLINLFLNRKRLLKEMLKNRNPLRFNKKFKIMKRKELSMDKNEKPIIKRGPDPIKIVPSKPKTPDTSNPRKDTPKSPGKGKG
jgi:hypothetical protein